jgi:hypothetical protein
MIKTKMTIPIRVLGVIGVLVLIISLYLPWATINGKELLGASGTYSAMDLVRNEESKILSYFFMGVYFILILALLGLIYSIVGRPTVFIGSTLFVTAGTYLILVILMGSLFQGVMPGKMKIPGLGELDLKDSDEDGLMDQFEDMFGTDMNIPDSDGDGLLDGEEVLEMPYSDPMNYDSDNDSINDKDDDTPLGGQNKGLEGNGSGDDDEGNPEDMGEMFDKVNEMNDKMSMLTNTTVKAENGVYVTTGTSVFVVIMGIFFKIDRRRRINLKIEKKYHKKDLSSYKIAVNQTLVDGHISEDEKGMLDVQRRTMGITEEEHYNLVMAMAEERKGDRRAIEELLSIIQGEYAYSPEGFFGSSKRHRRKRPHRGGEGPSAMSDKDFEREPQADFDDYDSDTENSYTDYEDNEEDPMDDEWNF